LKNKNTIIILSVMIVLIIAGIVFVAIMFFNRKGNITTATVKSEPIEDSTSTIVEKNGNTIPFDEDNLSESERTDLREPTDIDINPSNSTDPDLVDDELDNNEQENNQTDPNSPEATGVLQPVVEYKPIDVETTATVQNNVVLSINKPTYILFVDLTQAESAQMLFALNEASKNYNGAVDFAVISNFSAGKNEVINYLAVNDINLPLYFDNGTLSSPMNQYQLTVMPHSFIIDKNCNIVNSYSGYRSSDVISANLDIISENFE